MSKKWNGCAFSCFNLESKILCCAYRLVKGEVHLLLFEGERVSFLFLNLFCGLCIQAGTRSGALGVWILRQAWCYTMSITCGSAGSGMIVLSDLNLQWRRLQLSFNWREEDPPCFLGLLGRAWNSFVEGGFTKLCKKPNVILMLSSYCKIESFSLYFSLGSNILNECE